MAKIFKGKAWKFGDNIRADVAINYSPEVASILDLKELAKLCMKGYNYNFIKKVKRGDFIIAGENFACGHMHPPFYYSIIRAGISAVIADSTGRRFFRDAINAGLPVIIHKGISKKIDEGDDLKLDLKNGIIENVTKKEKITISKIPDVLLQILDA
jgi:3-isopropylmalate dehydratase small subunit